MNGRRAGHDAVVIGRGINSLACAALLARAGWDLCVVDKLGVTGSSPSTAYSASKSGYGFALAMTISRRLRA